MGIGSLRVVKRPGRDIQHPSPKERVEPYLLRLCAFTADCRVHCTYLCAFTNTVRSILQVELNNMYINVGANNFSPIFACVYILFISTRTLWSTFIEIGYRNSSVIDPCTHCVWGLG